MDYVARVFLDRIDLTSLLIFLFFFLLGQSSSKKSRPKAPSFQIVCRDKLWQDCSSIPVERQCQIFDEKRHTFKMSEILLNYFFQFNVHPLTKSDFWCDVTFSGRKDLRIGLCPYVETGGWRDDLKPCCCNCVGICSVHRRAGHFFLGGLSHLCPKNFR